MDWFDQAARNVAAMAWTIHTAGLSVDQFESLGFYVFAPCYRLDEEPTFTEYLALSSVEDKITRRIGLYAEAPEITARLGVSYQTTVAQVLKRLTIDTLAWEHMLDQVDGALQPTLREFYEACLVHNRPAATRGRRR